MSLNYIDITSANRDRNIWPLPSEFEIPLSQSGIKSKEQSVDPVSLSSPLFSWTSNNLLVNGSSHIGTIILPSLFQVDGSTSITYENDAITFVVHYIGPEDIQQLQNYYVGLVLLDLGPGIAVPAPTPVKRRIVASKYMGDKKMLLTVLYTLGDTFSVVDYLAIYDPTDFSDYNNPYIFVPNGLLQDDSYISYYLYNETINEYRPIRNYDILTHIITLDTSGSSTSTSNAGPINVSWLTTDNFSLRKQPPILPSPTTSYPLIISSVVSLSVINVIDVSGILSSTTDIYKNDFLRILPYQSSAPNYIYNFNPTPNNNESRRIISYSYSTAGFFPIATFSVYPAFTTSPLVNSPIEILPFSYDNLSPIRMSGSIISNQEKKCYEIQLLGLTLSNSLLKSSIGGSLSLYSYIYVEISNNKSGSNKNIIYSNNPHATNAIFRCPIYDVNNYLNTPFVHLSGISETQTIKFHLNDNLYFRVFMQDGTDIVNFQNEYYSPNAPNYYLQISALFSIKILN